MTSPFTYKVTNNSDPQCHTDTGYTCCTIAEIPVQLSPANMDRVIPSHSHLNLEAELRSTSAIYKVCGSTHRQFHSHMNTQVFT